MKFTPEILGCFRNIYAYIIIYHHISISLVGGLPTPLKNMSLTVRILVPNIWKVIKHVPNRQPVSQYLHWLEKHALGKPQAMRTSSTTSQVAWPGRSPSPYPFLFWPWTKGFRRGPEEDSNRIFFQDGIDEVLIIGSYGPLLYVIYYYIYIYVIITNPEGQIVAPK